jgi:hypothetical protein
VRLSILDKSTLQMQWLTVTNTLAYYAKVFIVRVKSFIELAMPDFSLVKKTNKLLLLSKFDHVGVAVVPPGACAIKHS